MDSRRMIAAAFRKVFEVAARLQLLLFCRAQLGTVCAGGEVVSVTSFAPYSCLASNRTASDSEARYYTFRLLHCWRVERREAGRRVAKRTQLCRLFGCNIGVAAMSIGSLK